MFRSVKPFVQSSLVTIYSQLGVYSRLEATDTSVSNWGGYAMAVGLALTSKLFQPHSVLSCEREFELLELTVANGGLDGPSGQKLPIVDGLAVEVHNQIITDLLNVFK